jgi:hypothetical protein
MKIKILRYVEIIWKRLFIAVFVALCIVAFFFPSFLVSREFAAVEHFPALVGAIFLGLCFISNQIADRLQASSVPPRKMLFKYIGKQIWKSLDIIIAAFFLGYCMYFMLMAVAPGLLHTIAPKEFIQLDVTEYSIWHSNKEFRKSCQYYIQFDAPEILSDMPSVCIDENQMLELRGAGYPTIHLEGQKSHFGYDLRYTK